MYQEGTIMRALSAIEQLPQILRDVKTSLDDVRVALDTRLPVQGETLSLLIHAVECALADLRSDLDLSKDAPGCGGENARAVMIRYLEAALNGKEAQDVQ